MASSIALDNKENKILTNIFKKFTINPYLNHAYFYESIYEENMPSLFLDICSRIKEERESGIEIHYLENISNQQFKYQVNPNNPITSKKQLTSISWGNEALLTAISIHTDSPLLGYETRNDGSFFQDVLPMDKYKETQTQKTNKNLYWHNDRTAHEIRPDLLCLLGMNIPEESRVETNYKSGKDIISLLSDDEINHLSEQHFITPYDRFSRDSNNEQIKSEPHAIINENGNIRYYENRTTPINKEDENSINALQAFKSALEKAPQDSIIVKENSLLMLPNMNGLHEKRIQSSSDDNSLMNRWLLKTYNFANTSTMNTHKSNFHPSQTGLVMEQLRNI